MNDGRNVSTSGAFKYVCERETDDLCPLGWAFYKDTGGYEGTDSCVYVGNSTISSWLTAVSSCPPGSHLLTVKHTSPNVGLWPFALSLHADVNKFIGCSQSSSATGRGSGWSWIDGTAATNLNCGSGADGCNLWKSGEPNDYPNTVVETHNEDYCRSGSNLLNDMGATESSLRPLCEVEVSTKCPGPGWAFYDDDGSEGADSCLYLSPHTVANWVEANSSCPVGTHLLTILSTSSSSKLVTFAGSLNPSGSAFIGCRQSSTATSPATGWSWTDGTSASNLNCGSAYSGCSIWNDDEPKWVCT